MSNEQEKKQNDETIMIELPLTFRQRFKDLLQTEINYEQEKKELNEEILSLKKQYDSLLNFSRQSQINLDVSYDEIRNKNSELEAKVNSLTKENIELKYSNNHKELGAKNNSTYEILSTCLEAPKKDSFNFHNCTFIIGGKNE